MSDEDPGYHVPVVEVSAAHKAFALHELRAQGCHHTALGYDPQFDSYFCQACNIWADPLCSDARCVYCLRRPVVPSLAHR